MSELIESIERDQLRRDLPRFREGDRVRVHFQVVEGTRRRTQVFEGVVIKLQGPGARRTFTVRKISFGVGVERTFPLHSPKVERVEVVARGPVRRAQLYYQRGRVGRAARVRERRYLRPEDLPPQPAPELPDGEPVPAEAAPAEGAEVEPLPAEAEAQPIEQPEAQPVEQPDAQPVAETTETAAEPEAGSEPAQADSDAEGAGPTEGAEQEQPAAEQAEVQEKA